MLKVFHWLQKREYKPLNKVYISKKNLLSNYRYLSSLIKEVRIAPVLKSNAYGHGIVEVGKMLDSVGAPFFCVDSIFEAYQLLKAKVQTPILIMGYVTPENLRVKKLPFEYAVWDLKTAKSLGEYQKGAKVHVFVDTGMHREGVAMDRLEDLLTQLKKLKKIRIVGLMSHFASANKKGSLQTKLQSQNFQKAMKIFQKLGIPLQHRHISASAGLFTTTSNGCNIARSGKALYGVDPLDRFNRNLKPVLKFTSTIAQIKELEKGGLVGYGGTFRAPTDMTVGILPLGYNDGVDRRLSNKGVVEVAGKYCPIIGMISMNITAVDLTGVKNPKVGAEVTIFSDHQRSPNSIVNTAKLCQTTPYDIMVNLVPTTRRVVLD